MSLFSSREWWNTRLGSGEEFDQGCLILANIDNAADGSGELSSGGTWTCTPPCCRPGSLEQQVPAEQQHGWLVCTGCHPSPIQAAASTRWHQQSNQAPLVSGSCGFPGEWAQHIYCFRVASAASLPPPAPPPRPLLTLPFPPAHRSPLTWSPGIPFPLPNTHPCATCHPPQ
jgi:hypothetical protein